MDQVDDGGDDDVAGDHEEQHGLGDREVVGVDRADQQGADAADAEGGLDDDRAA